MFGGNAETVSLDFMTTGSRKPRGGIRLVFPIDKDYYYYCC